MQLVQKCIANRVLFWMYRRSAAYLTYVIHNIALTWHSSVRNVHVFGNRKVILWVFTVMIVSNTVSFI